MCERGAIKVGEGLAAERAPKTAPSSLTPPASRPLTNNQQVGNLGAMMRDVKLDVYDFVETDETTVSAAPSRRSAPSLPHPLRRTN